jgi:hypothetical protein
MPRPPEDEAAEREAHPQGVGVALAIEGGDGAPHVAAADPEILRERLEVQVPALDLGLRERVEHVEGKVLGVHEVHPNEQVNGGTVFGDDCSGRLDPRPPTHARARGARPSCVVPGRVPPSGEEILR